MAFDHKSSERLVVTVVQGVGRFRSPLNLRDDVTNATKHDRVLERRLQRQDLVQRHVAKAFAAQKFGGVFAHFSPEETTAKLCKGKYTFETGQTVE